MKFLNETGLGYFLDKLKSFIAGAYVAINSNISIDNKAEGGDNIATIKANSIEMSGNDTVNTINVYDGFRSESDNRYAYLLYDDIFIMDEDSSAELYPGEVRASNTYDNYSYTSYFTGKSFKFYIGNGYYLSGGLDDSNSIFLSTKNNVNIISITPEYIKAAKFIKLGATSSQFLMGDGSVTEFNKANGVPKLDANGKLDSTQITALSNSDIDAIVI